MKLIFFIIINFCINSEIGLSFSNKTNDGKLEKLEVKNKQKKNDGYDYTFNGFRCKYVQVNNQYPSYSRVYNNYMTTQWKGYYSNPSNTVINLPVQPVIYGQKPSTMTVSFNSGLLGGIKFENNAKYVDAIYGKRSLEYRCEKVYNDNYQQTIPATYLYQTTTTRPYYYQTAPQTSYRYQTTTTRPYVFQTTTIRPYVFQTTTTRPYVYQTTTQQFSGYGQLNLQLPGINSFSISGVNLGNAVYRDNVQSVGSVMGKRVANENQTKLHSQF
jgi:hypothetical protein